MIKFIDLGLVDYREALLKQEELLLKKQNGDDIDYVILCSHPAVVTLGRSTKFSKDEISGWTGDVVETSRGGRATYHGPSQLVVYPIIDLKKDRKKLPAKDIHAYLRVIENTVIEVLKEFNITATRIDKNLNSDLEMTGVWVNEKKIAALGVAVKKWITMHGLALNVQHDPKAFVGISPCGFTSDIMTSMEKELCLKIDQKKLIELFKKNIADSLSSK